MKKVITLRTETCPMLVLFWQHWIAWLNSMLHYFSTLTVDSPSWWGDVLQHTSSITIFTCISLPCFLMIAITMDCTVLSTLNISSEDRNLSFFKPAVARSTVFWDPAETQTAPAILLLSVLSHESDITGVTKSQKLSAAWTFSGFALAVEVQRG